MVGVPEIAQVELLMLNPDDNAGVMVQLVIVPVVVGVWTAAAPMVSETVAGEKATVGLAIKMLRFTVAVPDPMLFDAVMV